MPIGMNKVSRNSKKLSGIPDSGVARFGFEGDYNDSWNDNNAQVESGSPSFTSTSYLGSQAAEFDDSNPDYLKINNFGDVISSSPISVAAWINADVVSDDDGYFAINNPNNDGSGFNLGINFGNIDAYIAGDLYELGSISTTGSYVHVVVTYDGTDLISYKNGANKTTNPNSINTFDATGYDAFIGTYFNTGFPYDGILDELRIYNKALTDTEVSNLYGNDSIV